MGLSFYYIPRSQNIPPGVIHLDTIQEATGNTLQLNAIKAFERN